MMDDITLSQLLKPVEYKVGDIIKYTGWTKDDTTPKLFKCIKCDMNWGVLWYNENGKKDSVGIAYAKKANKIEKFYYKLKK